jgi:hypothetical protein
MDDTDHAFFSSLFAELVATALKDTPVVMVTGGVTRFSRSSGRSGWRCCNTSITYQAVMTV